MIPRLKTLSIEKTLLVINYFGMTQLEIFNAIYSSSRQENAAIEQLFSTCFSKVRSIVQRNGLEKEDAQCIMQDATIDLVYKIKSGRFKPTVDEAFQRYILRYAKNCSITLVRKKSRFLNSIPGDLIDNEEDVNIMEPELIDRVLEIAQSKSTRGAEIVKRRFLDGQSYEQISTEMNYTSGSHSAKNQLHRTIMSIRDNINYTDFIID